MTSIESRMNSSNWITEYYYYFIFVIYFVSMFYNGIRVGIVATGLIVTIMLLKIIRNTSLKLRVNQSFLIPIVYIAWCGISIIWFGLSGVGYDSYMQAISNTLLPMFFIFFSNINIDKFWRNMLNAYILAGVIGTFLLVSQPQWYVRYCLTRGFDYRRLSFAYGSIIMGTMGAVAVIIALKIIIQSNGKRGKFQYLLTCLFAFLSMQRSAWIVVIVTLLLAHYYIFFKFRIVRIRFLMFEVIGLLIVFAILGNQIIRTLNSWITVRQLQYGGAITVGKSITERSHQWIRGIENSNWFIGSGFGSRGHKAAANGFANYVADGNWVLILCESGIIGLVLFIFACTKAVRKGIRNFGILFLPTGVLLAFLFQATGSNVWEQQLIAPLFWIAMGQILSYISD